jgi:hypothetical protein
MDKSKNICEETDRESKLSEEDKINLEKRMKSLLDESNQVFNRFSSNIDSLHRKIIMLFQVFLVLISVEIVVITYHSQIGFKFSYISLFLLLWVISWGIFSLGALIYLLYPRWYKDVAIFEEKRFEELCNLDNIPLLSDFLHQTKESYQFNITLYRRITMWLFITYVSIIVMAISYIFLILSLRIS